MENIDINLLLDAGHGDFLVGSIAQEVLQICRPLIGSPHSVRMRRGAEWFDLALGIEQAIRLLTTADPPDQIRTYTGVRGEARGSLGIERLGGVVCFSISIPMSNAWSSHMNLERLLLKIHSAAADLARAAVIAGPELIVAISPRGFEESIRAALTDTTLMTHLALGTGERIRVPQDFTPTALGEARTCIYRHRLAAKRLDPS